MMPDPDDKYLTPFVGHREVIERFMKNFEWKDSPTGPVLTVYGSSAYLAPMPVVLRPQGDAAPTAPEEDQLSALNANQDEKGDPK